MLPFIDHLLDCSLEDNHKMWLCLLFGTSVILEFSIFINVVGLVCINGRNQIIQRERREIERERGMNGEERV